MKLDKVLKVIGAIVAIAGVAVAIYFAVQKFIGKKEPEYFDDNDFFECDNDLEIIEVEEEKEEEVEEKKEEAEKQAPKKKNASAKKASK